MKFYTLVLSCLVLLAAHVHADDQETLAAMAKEILEECANEVGLSPVELEALMNPKNLPLPDEALDTISCLRACAFKKSGMLEDGKLIAERIKEGLSRVARLPIPIMYELKSKVETCVEKAHEETGDCHVVRRFLGCFHPFLEKEVQRVESKNE